MFITAILAIPGLRTVHGWLGAGMPGPGTRTKAAQQVAVTAGQQDIHPAEAADDKCAHNTIVGYRRCQ
ncbi:MAG: hypothetical protein JO345_39620 [Streptosporangiaceae bacterium]|nr:hypothetical protein [Streptosporangiaceae bacterium]